MAHAPSAEQGAIFDWFECGTGNLIARARAGTGKTTTVVEGVSRMPERDVLMAAFNKEIAIELERRVPRAGVEVRTLHSLGFRFVRQAWRVRMDEGGRRAFDLARRALPPGAPNAIVNLVSRLHTKARDVDPWIAADADATALVDFAARFDMMPDESWGAAWNIDVVCQAAHKAMRLATERTAVIDFADMIFLPLVHGWVRPTYDAVVVDEAQDMTPAQLTMAVGAMRAGGRMCIVGDDRQAIYAFRGADAGSLDRLKAELSARELGLTTTYRCGRKIVELAAQIVPDYRASPNAHDGEVADMAYAQAIAAAVPGDFILSRKNAPLVRACMTLLKRGVRARIKGRDIVAGIMALVRKLAPTDIDDLERKVDSWAAREIKLANRRLTEDAAADRIAFVMDQAAVVLALSEECDVVSDFERKCDELFADKPGVEAVMCSSVHRAKGLEADTVYLLRDTFREGSVEEDNIRYVAITRAKRRLVWVDGEAA